MAEPWDAVVVGAGPAGSTSALLLARLGLRVALLDRRRFPRPKACAEYMSPGVRQVLRRIGLEHTALRGALDVRGMDVITPSGALLPIGYALDGVPVAAVTTTRERFDLALLEAAATAGVEVLTGAVVRSVRRDAGTVCGVEYRSAAGAGAARATWTVIADGNRSTLVRALGLSRPARWPRKLGLVAHMGGIALADNRGRMCVERDGYCGFAPLPGGETNVALVVPFGAVARSGRPATAFFRHWLASHPRTAALTLEAALTSPVRGVGPIGCRARRAGVEGALLVGDAAGFFDPFTGEGIYRALRGAELLASAIEERGHAATPMGVVELYERLRRQEFRRKAGVTALVQLFVQSTALLEYAAPRLQTREIPRAVLGNVLGDIDDAAAFLRPTMMWAALRP